MSFESSSRVPSSLDNRGETVQEDVVGSSPADYAPDKAASSRAGQRVAHCISGAARTFWMPETHMLYKSNVIDRLAGEHHVFMALSLDINSHGATMETWNVSKYQEAIDYLEPKQVWWRGDDLNLVGTPDEIDNLLLPRNEKCGYDLWGYCALMIDKYEKEHNFTFDIVVKSRPDLVVLRPIPPISELLLDRITVNPYYEGAGNLPANTTDYSEEERRTVFGANNKNYGRSDLFWIAPRKYGNEMLRVYERPLKSKCGTRRNDCECKPYSNIVDAGIRMDVFPYIVRIRRSYQFCKETGGWNRFNSIC